MDQDNVLRGYLTAILWSEMDNNDDPLDSNYEISDITEESIEKAKSDIKAFVEKAKELFTEDELNDPDQIGHDLHLTRQGHGSGFWDGDYVKGDEITKITDKMGSVEVYVGDDGKVNIDSSFKGFEEVI